MNRIYKIEEMFQERKIAVGSYISLGDGVTTELMGNAGFDFLWVDMEHTQIDKGRLLSHFIAAQATGKPVFVRVEWNDPVLVKPVLDLGVDAVIFPMIMNKMDAEKAIRSCLYPPKGIRGYGPTRANMYGMIDVGDYINDYAESFWKIIQIEHIDAIRNLDEILSVEGIDSVLIGPSDLSGSVGLLQQLKHPSVKALFDEAAEKLRAKGIPFGVAIGFDEQNVQEWIQRGVSWISLDSDAGLLAKSARNLVGTMSQIINNCSN